MILLRGLPGSGKLSLAEKLGNYVSAEQFFWTAEGWKFDRFHIRQSHEWCQAETCRRLYANDGKVVVYNTFTTLKEVLPYLQMARFAGRHVHIQNCHGKFPLRHHVPQEVLDRMAERWQEELNIPDEFREIVTLCF